MHPLLGIATDELRKRLSLRTRRRLALARVSARRPTARLRKLPELLVLGTQRGGTSTLYKFLSSSPHLRPPIRKEIEYFSREYGQGKRWYLAHFPLKHHREITFEATPDYLFDERSPGRVAELLPDARFVVLLREPAARAWSHYGHMRRLGFEGESFARALELENERIGVDLRKLQRDPLHRPNQWLRYSYLARGLYATQLRGWFQWFPRERFYIARSEDFFADPATMVAEIHEFLSLPRWSDVELRNWSYGSGIKESKAMPEEIRLQLRTHFEAPNEALRELVGDQFCWKEPVA